MGAEELTFASALIEGGVVMHVHFARCEPCMYGSHPGGMHNWAGPEDIAHAETTGQESPVGKRCACDCADGPPLDDSEPSWDVDSTSLTDTPCALCGEAGACGYDAEGRPMIHATWMDEDES